MKRISLDGVYDIIGIVAKENVRTVRRNRPKVKDGKFVTLPQRKPGVVTIFYNNKK